MYNADFYEEAPNNFSIKIMKIDFPSDETYDVTYLYWYFHLIFSNWKYNRENA